MLRTLHLNTEPTWRGGEQQMCYLVRGLMERGHSATVLCPPESPCRAKCESLGLPVIEFRTRGDLDLMAARRLARIVEETGADIVHAHTARTVVPAAACKLFTRRPVRCVAHRRVDFSIHKLPLRLSSLKYRWGIDRFIAITRAVREVMIADGIPAEKIDLIHSATDISRFDGVRRQPGLRKALGVPEGVRVVGAVGALVDHKDHATLLDAAPLVMRVVPDVFFLIIGEGPLRKALEDRARRLGISHALAMPGFRADVPLCLAEMEVFCQPSWGEGLGSAVIEAFAMRLPVVATCAGGLPELIRDGESGLLVPPRDPAALSRALLRVLTDPALARQLGEAGRRTAETDFTADRMVEKTIALYMALLAKGREGAGG